MKKLRTVAAGLAALAALSLFGAQGATNAEAAGAIYYVDSAAGNDSAAGTSEAAPWKSLAKVSALTLGAGDTVYLKMGSVWNDTTLTLKGEGSASAPITVKAYGTGDRPVIDGPSAKHSEPLRIDGSYITVSGLLLRDGVEAGIDIYGNNTTVQDVEITNSGNGIYARSSGNLFTRNYIHDLRMSVNTQGGDDDYGAAGFWLLNTTNTEVSYNRIVNAMAPSYDYGYDGGTFQLYGKVSGLKIHHNRSEGASAFIEAGGGSAADISVQHNVSTNDYFNFIMVHTGSSFHSDISNWTVENNTVVKSTKSYRILDFSGGTPPPSGQFKFRNNIVYTATPVSNQTDFEHTNNIYHLYDGATLGAMKLGPGEKIADPMFANLSGGDLSLQAGSPAAGIGADLATQ